MNSTKDLNANLLLDDYTQLREEFQTRDNVDVKINWQVKPTAMVWGKVGYMDNEGSGSEFYLGFDDPSIGNTRVILTTFGTTWTLSPTMVLDGNFGMSRQDQDVLPRTWTSRTACSSVSRARTIRAIRGPTGCRASRPRREHVSVAPRAGSRCGARKSATRAPSA